MENILTIEYLTTRNEWRFVGYGGTLTRYNLKSFMDLRTRIKKWRIY